MPLAGRSAGRPGRQEAQPRWWYVLICLGLFVAAHDKKGPETSRGVSVRFTQNLSFILTFTEDTEVELFICC